MTQRVWAPRSARRSIGSAITGRGLGLKYDTKVFERVMDKYVHLDLYPDARQALADLKGYKLAILSNGSSDMLTTLVRNTGLHKILDATISINSKRIFKPSPEAYSLVEARLRIAPGEVLFVSSNPWDAIGAKSVGFNTAGIERVTPEAMAEACRKGDLVSPLTMFKAIRMQMDELGLTPDYRVHGLSMLVQKLSSVPAWVSPAVASELNLRDRPCGMGIRSRLRGDGRRPDRRKTTRDIQQEPGPRSTS